MAQGLLSFLNLYTCVCVCVCVCLPNLGNFQPLFLQKLCAFCFVSSQTPMIWLLELFLSHRAVFIPPSFFSSPLFLLDILLICFQICLIPLWFKKIFVWILSFKVARGYFPPWPKSGLLWWMLRITWEGWISCHFDGGMFAKRQVLSWSVVFILYPFWFYRNSSPQLLR